jgi:hypothetical protein
MFTAEQIVTDRPIAVANQCFHGEYVCLPSHFFGIRGAPGYSAVGTLARLAQ